MRCWNAILMALIFLGCLGFVVLEIWQHTGGQ